MINWSTAYETGESRVDRDHRALVEMLNELESAITSGRGSKVIAAIIERLAAYSATHFSYEESCMNRHQCPVAAANKAAHARFLQMLPRAIARLNGGGEAFAAQQVHHELSNWIVNHVLTVDSSLRGCLPAKPAR